MYEEALCIELARRGIAFENQVELHIHYKDLVLDKKFRADLLVEGKIIVDTKATSGLTGGDEAQLLNYLKATRLRVGLLLNFGTLSLEYKRRIL